MSTTGISFGPRSSKAPEVSMLLRSPCELKDSSPSKLALSRSSFVKAASSCCLGVSCGAASAACCGACASTGAASPLDELRAFCTAKNVAPSSTTPIRARRKGRETAIGRHIGNPPRLV